MKLCTPLACLGFAAALALPVFGQITYSNFSGATGLQLNGNAAIVGSVLRVTPATYNQAGSAFSTTAVSLASDASFSTFFQFRITNNGGSSDNDGLGADGIVFAVQTVANNVGGFGGGIGYLGLAKSVGVEYDTWNNGTGSGDPDGNHVNVDYSGAFSSAANAAPVVDRLNNGATWSSWVDYNGATGTLEVRLAEGSTVRPASALLSESVNLPTILGATNAFVGFTSGTGSAFADHDILSWEFRGSFDPIVTPPGGGLTPVPEASTYGLFGCGALMAGVALKRFRARQAVVAAS